MVVLLLLLACAGKLDSSQPDSGDSLDSPDSDDTAVPPTDADADGYFSALTGGDDCDDGDPYTHPGASDWCDGKDQDCDGDSVGAGMCAVLTDVSQLDGQRWWSDAPFERIAACGMWTNSMGDSLVTGGEYAWEPHVLPGLGIFTGAADGEQDVPHWWGCTDDYQCLTNLGYRPIGDFDGDGFDEFLSAGQDYGFREAAAFLLSGDASTWPEPGTPMTDSALASWVQTAGGDDFGSQVAGDVDLDDDSLSDFVAWAPDRGDDGNFAGTLHVMFGRTGVMPHLRDAGREVTFAHQSTMPMPPDDAFTWISVARDMDGDGFDEVIARLDEEDGCHFAVASGAELRSLDGANMVDVFDIGPSSYQGFWWAENGHSVGDVDRDGIDDLLMDLEADADLHRAVAFLSGALLSAGAAPEDAVLTQVQHDYTTYTLSNTADVDGDGLLDPVVAVVERYGDGKVCLMPTTRLPLGGTLDVADLWPCFSGGSPTLADLNHDGHAEFHFYTQPEDRVEILSIPDFDIPFGDPSKW